MNRFFIKNKYEFIAASAPLISIYFSLIIDIFGIYEYYFFVGIIFFVLSTWSSYGLVNIYHPFDPLAWFMFSSGLMFGLGMTVPFLLKNDLIYGAIIYRDLSSVVFLNYLSVLVITIIVIFLSKGRIKPASNKSGYFSQPSFLMSKLALKENVLLSLCFFIIVLILLSNFYWNIRPLERLASIASKLGLLISFVLGYGYFSYRYFTKILSIILVISLSVLGLLTLYKFNAAAPLAFFTFGILLKNKFSLKFFIFFCGYNFSL